jgi:hypothetical protein
MLKDASARKVGETAPDGAGMPALHPCPREGGALSDTFSAGAGAAQPRQLPPLNLPNRPKPNRQSELKTG